MALRHLSIRCNLEIHTTADPETFSAARIEEQKAEPGYVMNNVDYFVNHCTSTYLCKRAFMKTLEVHEASTGTKFGLKERQELCVAIAIDYHPRVVICTHRCL